jgi:multimeric flavodoxin WrbA
MKVLAINGSPRHNGNTAILINHVFDALRAEGIETEMVQLSGTTLRGCIACNKCVEKKDGHCIINNDIVNDILDKMKDADGIIFGSPTYFADVTAEMKALIDRCGKVAMANGGLLKRKAGAPVIAMRRGGATHAFDTINHFLHLSQMVMVGASYWNFGIGLGIGDVDNDEEGKRNMKVLGENLAWLLKKIR